MLLAPSASPFEICGYLLRCCEKINPQRIISDMDVGGSRQERVRSANSSLSSCTGMYNCLTVYFKRLTESYILRAATGNPQRIRSGIDAAGSTQKRRFCFAKTRVQKCTRMYTSEQAISKGLRKMCFQKRWRCVHLLRAAQNKYSTFQNGQGCPWFYAVAMFLHSKNSRSKIDKEVNF